MSYQHRLEESRQLASRMKNGTGAAKLICADNAPTHHMDALERFHKDFASYEKGRRQEQKMKRQLQLQRKRIDYLERESKRWEAVQVYNKKIRDKLQQSSNNHLMGRKRTANSNGLAYNPITLEYDKNPEGLKLKKQDEDTRIRGFVRAHNMDNKGNSHFNPLNGIRRQGIQALIPNELNERYQIKKRQHYDNLAIKIPSSANQNMRPNIYSKFY